MPGSKAARPGPAVAPYTLSAGLVGGCWKEATLGEKQGEIRQDNQLQYLKACDLHTMTDFLLKKKVQWHVFKAYSECYFNT